MARRRRPVPQPVTGHVSVLSVRPLIARAEAPRVVFQLRWVPTRSPVVPGLNCADRDRLTKSAFKR